MLYRWSALKLWLAVVVVMVGGRSSVTGQAVL